MKIRTGFVSNSSSSSFICEVTGREEIGMDIGLSDCDMSMCKKGHVFDNEYRVIEFADLSDDQKCLLVAENMARRDYDIKDHEEREKKWNDDILLCLATTDPSTLLEKFDNEEYDEDMQYGFEIPSFMCPICTFDVVTDKDAVKFLYKMFNTSEEGTKAIIKSKFKTFDEFQKFLTEKE